MAANAGLSHSKIRIDGLEVTGSSFLHKTGIGFSLMSENRTQAFLLELASGDIPLIDRPEADQSILYADIFSCHDAA